ncbi:MAG: ATP-binding protein [Gemmatimonadaceae bacterium]
MPAELPLTATAGIMALSGDERVRGLEATIRRRDAVLAAVSYAATRFLLNADWERDIRDVLARLGTAVEASRVYLFEGVQDGEGGFRVRMRNEWVADDVKPLPRPADTDVLDLAALGLGRWKALERGDVIQGPVDTMIPSEREYFLRLGMRSIASVPVLAANSWWGYLGFADDVTDRDWSPSVLEALQAAAAALGAAVYRGHSEQRLTESEARYRQLSDAAFEGVFIHDQGILLENNAAIDRVFGYEPGALVGAQILDLIATDESREVVIQRMRSKSLERYEVVVKRKDGTLLTAEITGRDTMYKGRPARVTTVHDVTDYKATEAMIRRRERQLAEAQTIARLGSWDWTIATNDLRGSDELYRIYGFEPNTVIAPGQILERVHPDDAERVRAAIAGAVIDGTSFSLQHRIVRPGNDIRHFHVEGRVVFGETGTPERILGTGQDITERYIAELVARRLDEAHAARVAAETAERRAAFLAEASRVLGSSFDYQTTLRTLTRLVVPALADYCTVDLLSREGAFQRVGVAHVNPEKEQLLWDITKWFRPGTPIVAHLKRALDDGETTYVAEITDALLAEARIDEEHGRILHEIMPRSIVAVPLSVSGKNVGVLSVYMSESKRRFTTQDVAHIEELGQRAALAVENARLFREAEEATGARDQMLGVVAHDLRNPLHTILMATALLDEGLEPGAMPQRQVAMVNRAGERMNRLIQDLLDVQRMDSGRLEIERQPVNARALLVDAHEMLRPLAEKELLSLTLAVPPMLPTISADAHRLHQVLGNLVGNAIKFTPKHGSILLKGEALPGEVRFEVSDTGPGIAADQLPHVFGQFWQASRTDRRGIGLGLAIAKAIVESHDGRIWVESVLGQGSSFFFTLPTSRTSTAQ